MMTRAAGSIDVHPLEEDELPAAIDGLPSRPPPLHRRRLERQARGGYTYLVGWLDGTPAGFVGLGLPEGGDVDDLLEFRGDAWVHDLNVEERAHRRGVARALMIEVERRAQAAHHRAVRLDTGTEPYFAPARALYRSLGYRDLGGVYLGGWSAPDTLWVKEL